MSTINNTDIPSISPRKSTLKKVPSAKGLAKDPTRIFFMTPVAVGLKWTLFDQEKLMAFDRIHDKLLEYDYNTHSISPIPSRDIKFDSQFGSTILSRYHNPSLQEILQKKEEISNFKNNSFSYADLNTPMIEIVIYGVDDTYHKISNSENLKVPLNITSSLRMIIKRERINAVISALPSPDEIQDRVGLVWIHLINTDSLPLLSNKYKINELMVAQFDDTRAHSSITPGDGELMISIVTFQLNDESRVLLLSTLDITSCLYSFLGGQSDEAVCLYEKRVGYHSAERNCD